MKSKRRLEMGEEAWAEYQRIRKNKKGTNYKKRQGYKYTFAVIKARRNKKRKLIAYKGGKCEACGYDKDIPGAYDFHHIDPSLKEFQISRNNLGFERCKKEIDKCMLLCCRCHSEVHHQIEELKNAEWEKKIKSE